MRRARLSWQHVEEQHLPEIRRLVTFSPYKEHVLIYGCSRGLSFVRVTFSRVFLPVPHCRPCQQQVATNANDNEAVATSQIRVGDLARTASQEAARKRDHGLTKRCLLHQGWLNNDVTTWFEACSVALVLGNQSLWSPRWQQISDIWPLKRYIWGSRVRVVFLDCYWVGSWDFNFLVEIRWSPLNPRK